MAKLSKTESKFTLEMSEQEIRNLVGSLNSGHNGRKVLTQRSWAAFLNGYTSPRMEASALIGDPAFIEIPQDPFSD